MKKEKENKPVTGEKPTGKKCPYCISKKEDSNVIESYNKFQCLNCGKMWDEGAFGKVYSLELERGESWAREMEARRLKER